MPFNLMSLQTVTNTKEELMPIMEVSPEKRNDVREVQNYIDALQYSVDRIIKEDFPLSSRLIKEIHKELMKGVRGERKTPGEYRISQNWIGGSMPSNAVYVPPAHIHIQDLISDMEKFIHNDNIFIPKLIRIAMIHYQFESIHPFLDGNGRMGRLWQTLILIQQYPVFEFLPIEILIKQRQEMYYAKLSESDKKGHSTPFVEFMLNIILDALEVLLNSQNQTLKTKDRIALFQEKIGSKKFSRKDYLQNFKSISAPTASRDLKWAVEQGILKKEGEQRLVQYWFII